MKIRSRLLLFLLPPMILCILLVSFVLSYYWYKEILETVRSNLKSAVVAGSALIDTENIQDFSLKTPKNYLYDAFEEIQKELEIQHLYLILPKDLHSLLFKKIDFSLKTTIDSLSLKDLHIQKKKLPFFSEESFLSAIYQSLGQKVMTGYAPIFDKEKKVIALLGADVNLSSIQEKFQKVILIILLSAGLTILMIVLVLFAVANKIARPVQKLSNTALTIASGQYGERVHVEGPKEIMELSQTLSTMSECLLENINRLKENSLIRERMYGEVECARLLQNHMLQKVIDECPFDVIALKNIALYCPNPQGLLLDILDDDPTHLDIHLVQANEEGFAGMYQLLTNFKLYKEGGNETIDEDFSSLHLRLQQRELTFRTNNMPLPLVFSRKKLVFYPSSLTYPLDVGDFIFLYNNGLLKLLHKEEAIQATLAKTLRFFSQDGLETCMDMIKKELNYLTKRKALEEDIHLLCFQLLY